MNPITVVSYNIHKGMSPFNRMVRLMGMGDALQMVMPDILCLQEVSGQNLKRAVAFNEYPHESQHRWFGEYLKLKESYGKNAEYTHGHHGNAVLSRHPLDPKHNVNITVSRLEKRGVLHCEIHPYGWRESVVVLNAHLNLLHKDRVRQYQAILEYIDHHIGADRPLILAGDFNDWSIKSSKILGKHGLTEAFFHLYGDYPATFPAKVPMMSLDRIYVRNLRIKRATVHSGIPWSRLSDHLPISAVLEEL